MAETATQPASEETLGMVVGGVPTPGVFNLRDLGGPVGSAGTLLNPGLVFRADGIHRTDAEGADRILATTGVRQVIDLRTEKELQSDGRFDHADVVHHHLPILEDLSEFAAAGEVDDLLRHHYVRMANKNGATLAAGLALVADAVDAGQPILYHCTAGKDRTGLLTALLLAGLGLDDELIAADYARSAHGMRGLVGWYSARSKATPDTRLEAMGMAPETAAQMIGAKKESMLGALADLRSEHGTVHDLLASLDATDSIARIGRHILAA